MIDQLAIELDQGQSYYTGLDIIFSMEGLEEIVAIDHSFFFLFSENELNKRMIFGLFFFTLQTNK